MLLKHMLLKCMLLKVAYHCLVLHLYLTGQNVAVASIEHSGDKACAMYAIRYQAATLTWCSEKQSLGVRCIDRWLQALVIIQHVHHICMTCLYCKAMAACKLRFCTHAGLRLRVVSWMRDGRTRSSTTAMSIFGASWLPCRYPPHSYSGSPCQLCCITVSCTVLCL